MATDKRGGGLEGIIAGNTAIATVGKEGKGLTYRGYSIHDLAEHSTFEEVAYLLIYGRLPKQAELEEYKLKLRGLSGLPASLKTVLEHIPRSTHPMDVMRTGCSVLGAALPEKEDHGLAGAREIGCQVLAGVAVARCCDSFRSALRDHRTAGLPRHEVAILDLAEKLCLHAYKIAPADMAGLRAHGLSDEEILDVVLVAAARNFYSKVVDALGAELHRAGCASERAPHR